MASPKVLPAYPLSGARSIFTSTNFSACFTFSALAGLPFFVTFTVFSALASSCETSASSTAVLSFRSSACRFFHCSSVSFPASSNSVVSFSRALYFSSGVAASASATRAASSSFLPVALTPSSLARRRRALYSFSAFDSFRFSVFSFTALATFLPCGSLTTFSLVGLTSTVGFCTSFFLLAFLLGSATLAGLLSFLAGFAASAAEIFSTSS